MKQLFLILFFATLGLGARNPFEPPHLTVPVEKPKNLASYDLHTLKLQAILWNTDQNMALFETPEGETFFAAIGTKIGKKGGKVTKIDDNIVIVAGRFGKITFSISDP